MKLEIKITGQADNPRAVAQASVTAAAAAGLEDGRANVSYGNVQSLYPLFPGVSDPVEEQVEEQASVMAVSFASSKGAALADELNVPLSAFEGAVPSGKRGFTVGDVRRIAGG
jgi:hypothetical protein